MRCLLIGNFGTGWDGSICDEEHIAKALEDLGHEVIRQQREEVTQSTFFSNGVRLPDVDFTLIAQWDSYGDYIPILPKPLVYWAFDYQADGQEWHERLVKMCDLYLSKRIADVKFPNWQWLSQDFAPNFLGKHPGEKELDIDVLFTGSYLPWATERNKTLKAVDKKFNLVIHSVNEWPGFKDVRPPIMDEGLPELYARAKVILSIDHTIEAGYWSDRNAQIMMCYKRPLFRYVPLSEVRFGNSVSYFHNIEDCLRKIESYMSAPDWGGTRAAEWAWQHLSVERRVKDLLIIVENYLENSNVR